jgi:outer membrane protein TolC
MSRFQGKIGAFFVLLAAAAPGLAQQPLTLRQAIDQALGQSPQTAVAHADEKAASAQASMARTALLPQLQFTEDLSRGNDPVYAFGTKLRQQRFAQSDFSLNSLNRPTPTGDFVTRFKGSWQLFDGLATEKRIRGAKLAEQSATSMSSAVQQAVVLQVVQAYEAVLYAQREVEIARHEVATAQALLRDAQSHVKAGLAVDSDSLAAQVNLAARQQDEIAAEGNVETAWAQLETAMGATTMARPELAPLQAKSYPGGALTDDIAEALKARPDLKALRLQIEAQQKAVGAARGEFLPKIDAYGNWETDRTTFAGDGGNNWVAGVQLNFDLLPLGKRAKLRQEQAAQAKIEAEKRSQELQIRLAVERAYTGHETAERMVTTAQAAMQQSAEALRILRNRYDAGLTTMTDLLRAEDAQRTSQNNYWRAAWGNTVAYAELLYTTGQLTPESAEKLQ